MLRKLFLQNKLRELPSLFSRFDKEQRNYEEKVTKKLIIVREKNQILISGTSLKRADIVMRKKRKKMMKTRLKIDDDNADDDDNDENGDNDDNADDDDNDDNGDNDE